jgi:hypothetical protein
LTTNRGVNCVELRSLKRERERERERESKIDCVSVQMNASEKEGKKDDKHGRDSKAEVK